MAGGNKVIGVMSRNLYLGADLGPVIAAQNLAQFVATASAAWAMVQRNDFHARVHALAAEIAERRPALVGLQEAFTWHTVSRTDGKATVVYDYIPELLAALAERGLEYRLAAHVELLQFQAPTVFGFDVRTTDHGAILAREDVQTSNAIGKVFSDANLLPLSVLGTPLLVKRGYLSADVKYRGELLRFVSTHLESFHPVFRAQQAKELAAVLAGEARPLILVGDLNSHPGVATDGAGILAAAGFQDVWAALHPADPGLTCCFLEDLTRTAGAVLSERIDFALTRGPLEPRKAVVLGADPSARAGGLWPSDHAGVFAEVRIGR
jgi:endonuclease/exonuclease/phosphatase family metal-dependent hydrolase